MFKSRIAFCKVSNWAGGGGEHSYGRIFLEEKEEPDAGIELLHKLTERQAIYLNKKNSVGLGGLEWKYKKGDASHQFDSIEEVYAAAEKYLEDNNLLEQYDFLLEGDFGSYPCYTIWSRDDQIKRELNGIYKKYEGLSSYSKLCSSIINQWKDLAIEYNILKRDNEDN